MAEITRRRRENSFKEFFGLWRNIPRVFGRRRYFGGLSNQ
jgi:hypothetical protein